MYLNGHDQFKLRNSNTTSSFQYRRVRRGVSAVSGSPPPETDLLIIHKGKTRKAHGRSSPSRVQFNSPYKVPARRTTFQYPLWEPHRHLDAPATNHSSKFVFSKVLSSFLPSLIVYRHAEVKNECIPIADGKFFAQVRSLDKPKHLWLHPHVA